MFPAHTQFLREMFLVTVKLITVMREAQFQNDFTYVELGDQFTFARQ